MNVILILTFRVKNYFNSFDIWGIQIIYQSIQNDSTSMLTVGSCVYSHSYKTWMAIYILSYYLLYTPSVWSVPPGKPKILLELCSTKIKIFTRATRWSWQLGIFLESSHLSIDNFMGITWPSLAGWILDSSLHVSGLKTFRLHFSPNFIVGLGRAVGAQSIAGCLPRNFHLGSCHFLSPTGKIAVIVHL